MSQRLFLVAAWLALAFIAFATLCPLRDRPAVAGSQLEHFAAFALMGFAFARGYPSRVFFIVTVVICSAFALEALQLLTLDRHGRLIEALVKSAGGTCGIIVGHFSPLLLRGSYNRLKGIRRNRPPTF